MSGAGSKYFTTTKKGEVYELKEELNSSKEDKKKEAVKKVIASMTEGKDVSVLFTDVLNCMQTHNLELKKLVYLYLMNYAKSHPDRAILAVNTFQNDASDPNPLIRALAVRTMSCIRVEKITEYLCEPLRLCLKDKDPYVRKTAAVAVAKLYDINSSLVENQGFIDILSDLISDSNPMVVANAVASLSEINDVSSTDVFVITPAILNKLLAALNECTEWGQVFVLDALAKYVPKNSKEASTIAERVAPRLNHANSAVVLSSVKVLMLFLDRMTDSEEVTRYLRKMSPPLISFLSSGKDPEIQYVALRNISIVVQKRPEILKNELKVFFCKYNDPIYVKLEKLEVLIMLSTEKNIDIVLPEYREYATMVDVEFVRKAVRAIGRCAIKLKKVADRCVDVLLNLIQTKVNYVVQEAIVVIKDIFRRYPNKYEKIISTLCDCLDTLDEPEAKASMIWIIGEYAERIDNAEELLESFLDTFGDESPLVQLQLLTATVKLFLKRPQNSQEMVQQVLNKATQESGNPDLRDRGFIYWRLLSSDPDAAKRVVLAKRPLIEDSSNLLAPQLLDTLVHNISTLSSVFHKPPETFVSKVKVRKIAKYQDEEEDEEDSGEYEDDHYTTVNNVAGDGESKNKIETKPPVGNLLDLDILTTPDQPSVPSSSSTAAAADPLDLGFFNMPSNNPPRPSIGIPPVQRPLVLSAEKGKGMQISAVFARQANGKTCLDIEFANFGPVNLSNFAIQFNKNFYGMAPAGQPNDIPLLVNGQKHSTLIPVSFNPLSKVPQITDVIQMAVKNSTNEVFYFEVKAHLHDFLINVPVSMPDFRNIWQSVQETQNSHKAINVPSNDIGIDAIVDNFKRNNFLVVTKREAGDKVVYFFSGKLDNGVTLLLETRFSENLLDVTCRITADNYENILWSSLETMLGWN